MWCSTPLRLVLYHLVQLGSLRAKLIAHADPSRMLRTRDMHARHLYSRTALYSKIAIGNPSTGKRTATTVAIIIEQRRAYFAQSQRVMPLSTPTFHAVGREPFILWAGSIVVELSVEIRPRLMRRIGRSFYVVLSSAKLPVHL